MNNYRFGAFGKIDSWFKPVSRNKAIKIWEMGKTVYLTDKNFCRWGQCDSTVIHDFVRDISRVRTFSECERDAVISRLLQCEEDKNPLMYYIPVAWYNRFSGEEVEPFDTVRGLEEYNRDYERI